LVDKGGNISSVQALNDPGYGAKAAAENLIIKGPRWKPAVQNGQVVNASVKRTISFEVK
jgi:protein TonB